MYNLFTQPSQSRELGFSSLMGMTDYLLRGKNARRITEMYPEEEPLQRCESEQKDVILFIAKGCKIPEYLEDKPYALIREGRLIKVS